MAIELGSAYGKVELDASGVKKGTQQAQSALATLDGAVQDVFKFSMGNLAAQGIGKLIGGMSDLYGETRALATGFQSEMAVMSTAVDPATASMETLKDAAMAVGGDISLVGIDAEQAAEAMTGLFKSGKDVGDVFGDLEGYMAGTAELGGILRASVDLQAASMLDLDGATTLVNSTMSTYGLTAEDAVRITDNFVKTADASQAEVTDLAEAHQNAAIVLASFGYTLEDTNTALALLSENALKGAEAGTSLRAMVNQMLRPTKKVNDAWNELNISLYDSEGQLKRIPDIIGEMIPALQNLSEERRNELAYILAGADGQRALNILLSKGTTGWQEMEQAIAGASSAQEVAAARAKTLQGAQEALEGTLDTLKIRVGDEFIPVWTRMTQGLAEFYDTHGPQIVAVAGKIADGVTAVMDALEKLDPALVNSAVQLAGLTVLVSGGHAAFAKITPVINAAGPALSQLATGLSKGSIVFKAAGEASLGFGATLGTLVISLGAVVLSVIAINEAIQLHKDIVEQTGQVEDAWAQKLESIAANSTSAADVVTQYASAQEKVNTVLEESNQIAVAFIDKQKVLNANSDDLNNTLISSASSYEDYVAAAEKVNVALTENSRVFNVFGRDVTPVNAIVEGLVPVMDEFTFAARRNAESGIDSATAWEMYSQGVAEGEKSMLRAAMTAGQLAIAQAEATASAEEQAMLYDSLSKSLSNTGLSQSAMTRAQGELAAQMGYTTRLVNMQASAMNALAFEHAQGNLSLEQYIAAGQQVQAVQENSVAGYQAVMGVVQEATGKYQVMGDAVDDLPRALYNMVTAAQESAAAQEELAQRAAAAWETFAGNVQTGVANALDAYKSGNTEMLAEQQRALGEMLWTQTDQMLGMGQITQDQAMEMKSALAGEFGIVVDEVSLATTTMLGLFSDWAAGGQTSADQVVAFIQNIGTESATLAQNAEADIAAQIAAWEEMKASTDTSSAEVMSLMREMGLTVDEQGNLIESALGEAGGAAGTMAGDVEGASARAVTAIGRITGAIEDIPEYKKIEIQIEKSGDEAFDFGSPQFRFFYALEDLVQYAKTHPVEIDVASQMDGGMALGAAAMGGVAPAMETFAPAMAALAPVTAPTMVGGGVYDQRQYNVSVPVTAVQDALDVERLAQRVVALIRSRG